MSEITAVLMFLGLAFGLGIAAMIVGCAEAIVIRYSNWKRNRMPERIRALNKSGRHCELERMNTF